MQAMMDESKQMTREQLRKQNAMKTKRGRISNRPNRKLRIRLLPIWLRLLIVVLLCVVFVLLGAYVGYVVIGGGSSADVFEKSTWSHIGDLVNKGIKK